MHTKFTVGELAKFSGLPKQTLIYYDKENVFKPKFIDPMNGYRYYTADQIEVLESILILKEMGLSLKEIKDFMKSRNSDNALALMKKQYEDINAKIRNLKIISKRLERKIETLEEFYEDQKNMDIITISKSEYLAIEAVEYPKGSLEVDLALRRLLSQANEFSYPHYYQIGDMVSVENLLKKKYVCFEYACLPLEVSYQKGKIHKKQKGLYARCYHIGSYDEIGKTYERVLEFIDKKGFMPIGYSYEYCMLDSLTCKKTVDYITEIQIQIIKK